MRWYVSFFLAMSFICHAVSVSGRTTSGKVPKEVSTILKHNKAGLKTVKQLIVVYNDTAQSHTAVLAALEKRHRKWVLMFGPMQSYIGRNGFAAYGTKCEGDGKTPAGLYGLGCLFCYQKDVDTQMPAVVTTPDDKWIDDPQSDDYNTHVRGATSAASFEKLLIRSDAYKYCMVIEYNTRPVVKGKGSAIFFHLGQEETSGCVTITEENMKKILNWLTPTANPSMLMGNLTELYKGL
jgi:L,D-peptidoglycan transpeptidase YkuD (ErfK/YbiS/YcfS/YnhG family)